LSLGPGPAIGLIGHDSCPIGPMDRVGAAGTDPIAEALGSLGVHSSVFCLSEFRAPWGFRVDGAGIAKFHMVLEGAAWLRLGIEAPHLVGAGDLVLIPRGQTHTMSDEPASAVTGLDQLLLEHPLEDGVRLRCGGSGALTRVLCGGFSVGGPGLAELLGLVPDILVVDGQSLAATSWLAPVLSAIEDEVATARPGAGAIQSKIADVFVAQAVRSWLIGADQAGVLPVALLSGDEAIRDAMNQVRNDLRAQWTIDKLASNVGLSRTAFVERFRKAVGDSPMHYVSRLRLSAAAGLLITTRQSVHEVALATGYENDASLSKAFRREFGVAPGTYRAAAGQLSLPSEQSSP
jgi:AraC-like DNA-binding protein